MVGAVPARRRRRCGAEVGSCCCDGGHPARPRFGPRLGAVVRGWPCAVESKLGNPARAVASRWCNSGCSGGVGLHCAEAWTVTAGYAREDVEQQSVICAIAPFVLMEVDASEAFDGAGAFCWLPSLSGCGVDGVGRGWFELALDEDRLHADDIRHALDLLHHEPPLSFPVGGGGHGGEGCGEKRDPD